MPCQRATETLIRRDALIDKLIGDEVMALVITGFCGYKQRAAEASLALMKAVGYGAGSEPWMPIGGAVNARITYGGNVGSEGVLDFTALGDTVITASRLASSASAGEVLLSEDVFRTVAVRYGEAESRILTLRSKEAPLQVRVLRASLSN